MKTLLLASLLAMTGCMMLASPPKDLDYSRTRMSEHRAYRGTIHPKGDSIQQGKLQSWTLHLEDTTATPIDSAVITVDGGMPQHGHGLPTKPRVTRALGNGDHLVEGLKFNMGGWWVVKFAMQTPKGADTIVFNLKL